MCYNCYMNKAIDLSKILTREHEGKWVVLSDDYKKVIDFSDNLMQLKERVGVENVIYIKAPVSGISYAFNQ